MKIVDQSIEILTPINGEEILKHIEHCGRVCYKSEDKITADSAAKFVTGIMKSNHESVIEHYQISVKAVTDRGVSHEIVRHRIASYSQESTRYCNYGKDKFGNEITVCRPSIMEAHQGTTWYLAMQQCEKAYFAMLDAGSSPQLARSVLPNSLKTEIVMTMNLREWRHFFKLRTAPAAHPDIRVLANMILTEFRKQIPVIFDTI